MAGPSLQAILGYATLSKAIMLTSQGVPNLLPPAFMASHTKCVGPNVRWRQFTGERRTAQRVKYGAPPVEATLRDIGERTAKAVHFNEKISLDPLIFKQLQSPNSYEHDPALFEVNRQLEAFGTKFGNTRITANCQTLKSGVLYFDTAGNLLPSATGADSSQTINFGMNANNQGQANGIIASSWAIPTTDIVLHLRKLKKQARRLTGKPLKKAMYGENIPSYFFNNASVQQYLARHSIIREKYVDGAEAGEIPNGLFGFEWIPLYEQFYEDANATNQDVWSPDHIVFTPEVDQDWWDVIEGSYEVPTTINIQGDGMAAMRSMKTVHGMGGFGFVVPPPSPPTVMSVYFDTFLGVLKNPDAIFQLDVAF
jgi:Phage major capsid protein E